jgi:uncharacterized protein (TIGR00369 family)
MSHWTDRLDALTAGDAKLPPVTEYLRMGTLTRWEPGTVLKEWPLDEVFLNPGGILYGGYLTCLADQMLTFTAMTMLSDAESMRTSDLQIAYFRPVAEGPLRIEGRIVNRSRSHIHIDVSFTLPNGKLAARATGVMAVVLHDPNPVRAEALAKAAKPS